MTIPATDLAARVARAEALGLALLASGRPLVVGWMADNDDRISVNLAAVLDDGETIEDVEAHLWRLYAVGESEDVADDGLLQGAPEIDGTTVVQRIGGLARGRAYALDLTFGAVGNRRGRRAFIDVLA